MRYTLFCFLFFIGVTNCLYAQDRIVTRSGRTYDVKIDRIDDENVRYTYPPDVRIYLQPKTAISYIQYADGRREFFDGTQQRAADNNTTSRVSSGATTPGRVSSTAANNRLLSDDDEEDENFWQDVKTTFTESDVKGMVRLNRITASSDVSYRDAIQQLKRKAAAIGGTNILVMDVPENEVIEIIGVVYRDEKTRGVQRNANTRSNAPVESSADVRRRRIAQQMESYHDESSLEYDDYSKNTRNAPTSSRGNAQPERGNTQPSRGNAQPVRDNNTRPSNQPFDEDEPDAVFLMNGRVIKGIIEEYDPEDFVSIRISNGRVYEYAMDEVKRVSQTSSGYSNNNNNRRSSAPARNANEPSPRGGSKFDDRYNNSKRQSSSRYDDYDDYGDYEYSASGYRGIFDVGFNVAMGKTGERSNFEINTSHGYRINEYLFAGAGLGLHIYSARDSLMKNPNVYPHYAGTVTGGKINLGDTAIYIHAVDSSYLTLPIFLDFRGYLPLQNDKIAPFIMFRFGYAFNLSDGFSGMGIYLNPAVGLKIKFSPQFGAHFSLGYAYQSYGGIPKEGGYGYWYIKDSSNDKYEAKGAGGISLKLGIEF